VVIPRGIVFSVEIKDAAARGYILEAQKSEKYSPEWL
jgi:homogentisate 1,2-dioxygenase